MELRGHLPLADDSEIGKTTIMIKKRMQFDGPLGSAKFCPAKEAHTEINDGKNRFIGAPRFGVRLCFGRFNILHIEKDGPIF